MEIPGILNAGLLVEVKKMILDLMQTYSGAEKEIDFVENEKEDSVLINSNFNCGFYIHRDRLYSILRSDKYKLEAAFDPCSYPGVKCKFYFNNEIGFDSIKQTGVVSNNDQKMKLSELNDNKKYTEVSFMIFRTGSCLIVGNCSEPVLYFIFDFIKGILTTEYENICASSDEPVIKIKKNKLRKKTILVTKSSCTF
jgi:hypothetical protein